MDEPLLTRLMLVEDDEDIRAIASLVLESVGGFTLKVCSSGIQMLKEAPDFKPQLILMDMMMPGMDGLNAFNALKKIPELAQTRVIFMTAKVQAYEVENYKKLGALDVIRKPFEPMSLPNLIQEIWKRKDPSIHE